MTSSKNWLSGLAVRHVLQLVCVGVIFSVLLSWNAAWTQKRTINREVERRGELLGETLAGACSLPYLLGDLQAVESTLRKAALIQDVVSIALLDASGKVVRQFPEDAASSRKPVAAASDKERVAILSDSQWMKVTAPIKTALPDSSGVIDLLAGEDPSQTRPGQTRLLGHVYVLMTMNRVHQQLRGMILRSILATLAIIIFGSVLAFIFFRKTVLNPMNALIVAMTAVQKGNLEVAVEDTGGSREIETLMLTFNIMTQDLRHARQGLQKLNSELEERVASRTQELTVANREIQEAQETVVRSEKLAAIGQLASGVGHELRNPLAAINNAVYYIRDAVQGTPLAAQDQNLVEFLNLADREIRNATNIIRDLLDFARTPKLVLQPTDINGVLLEAKGMVEIPPMVKVVERLGEDLPQLTVDHEKMRQVFINLLQNAAQAMTKGGELSISTRLEAGPADSKQRFFLVEVRDTGSGIKEQDRRKIFEPLFTTKAKGTGLGLPISLGIVQKHGGEIVVVSKEGTGATFTVRLPLGAST